MAKPTTKEIKRAINANAGIIFDKFEKDDMTGAIANVEGALGYSSRSTKDVRKNIKRLLKKLKKKEKRRQQGISGIFR